MKKISTMLCLICLPMLLFATIRYVPSQYGTIQEAVNASASGDTIMVAAGTYFEHVVIGLNLTLLGDGMETTTIDAMFVDKCVRIQNNGTSGKVSGFTFQNSGSQYTGGAYDGAVTIQTTGTGFWEICWNKFMDCPTGMLSYDGGEVYRNIFENCGTANFPRAIFASSNSNLDIYNNDFRNNNYAIYAHSAVTSINIYNNIIVNNSVGISIDNTVWTIDYNDVWSNNTNYMSCYAGPNDISENPLFVGGTPYSYQLQAGSPCIDAGNPASPLDPDGTIADMGVFYFPQGGELDIDVILTPYGIPIQIPANGGSFEFNVELTNNESSAATFDAWTMATFPNGSTYGPILNVEVTLGAGVSVDRDRIQFVPAGAPSGDYTYDAYVGIYPSIIYDEDHFDFEKLAVGDGILVSGWDCWGEDFGDLSGNTAVEADNFTLLTAYPNPFNPVTNLQFNLPQAGEVKLAVYDVQGREIAVIFDGWQTAGYHESSFNASDLASGVYFAMLQTSDARLIQKLLLVK